MAEVMKSGYDLLAFGYDLLAKLVFGKSLVNSQTVLLNGLASQQSLLVIGGGTGWWLHQLLRDCPLLHVTFIDASAAMIDIAKRNSESHPQIHFIHGTQEDIPASYRFDAVILFYFADLFSQEELAGLIRKINTQIERNGMWLLADFVNHKWWHGAMLKIMYTFFRATTGLKTKILPDWVQVMEQAGFQEEEQYSFYGGFIRSILYR